MAGKELPSRNTWSGSTRRNAIDLTSRFAKEAFRPVADEGAHPLEGGRIGCEQRLERQPDRRGIYASIATVERTRRQLVEEGFEAVLARKYNSNSARRRIFDGAAEAKLIALTLSPAPAGFARWSLRLLEEKVVELHIVERASDNTIGRTLKKNSQAASQAAMGDSA